MFFFSHQEPLEQRRVSQKTGTKQRLTKRSRNPLPPHADGEHLHQRHHGPATPRKLPRRVLMCTRESTTIEVSRPVALSHEMGLTPRLDTSKKAQEHQRLRGPATADLSGQNIQATATAWCDELRIGSLLSSSRCGQTEPIHVCHHTMEPVRDNFKSATILHVHGLQIQVAHHYVGGHSGAGLTAHPGSSTLERKTPSCQHPARAQAARWWPKASMGRPHRQKRRARGVGAGDGGIRECGTAGSRTTSWCGHSGQCNTSTTSTLRPHKLSPRQQGWGEWSSHGSSFMLPPLIASISNSSRF